MAVKGCLASFLLGTDVVASLKNVANALTGDSLDTSTFDCSCTREFIAGLRSGTIDISGDYDSTDTTGQAAMMTSFLTSTILESAQKPKILWDGVNGITADALITAIAIEAAVDGIVSFSATLQLTGTIAVV
jgi:predicted secreted protein